MLTSQDMKKLKKELGDTFVTKEEIIGVKSEIKSFKEEVITRFDAVMGELQAMREKMAVSTYRQSAHT